MISFNEYGIKSKWNKTGLLEGLSDNCKCYVALDSQIKINENKNFSYDFQRVSLPILRRVFGGLVNVAIGTDKPLKDWFEFENNLRTHIGQDCNYLTQEANLVAELSKEMTDTLSALLKEDQKIYIHGLWESGNKISINYEIR